MDFQFTHEQQLWSDTLQNFMEREVGREYTREHDASREFPEEVYQKMARQGWLGLQCLMLTLSLALHCSPTLLDNVPTGRIRSMLVELNKRGT